VTFNRRVLLRATLGIGISVLALWILLHSVDIGAAMQVVATASPAWVAVMVVMVILDVGARGARWQVLLAPIKAIAYRRVLGYTYVGYLANNVLPARLGELVRCHYLGDREGISRTTALGTVVVERVVDTAVVVTIASLAIVVLQVKGLVANAVLFGLAVTAIGIVLLAVLVVAHRLPGAERVVALAEGWPRVADVARKLHGGLAVAGRPRTLLETLMLSGLAWAATIVSFAAAGQAIGVELTTAQAALLASGVALATAVPAGPGNLGTFDLAGVVIASSFGLESEQAVALVVLAHAAALVVTSVGGATSLLLLGWVRQPPVPVSESQPG
jgi:uncharacterized protein (TIRG00374 family)